MTCFFKTCKIFFGPKPVRFGVWNFFDLSWFGPVVHGPLVSSMSLGQRLNKKTCSIKNFKHSDVVLLWHPATRSA